MTSLHIQTYLLQESDWVPNNPQLPVVFYQGVFEAGAGATTASDMESLFWRNGWEPRWRDSVYHYHHYHTTAHEVLGFATGSARLQIGGPHGREINVTAGQALLIPCGVAHCCLEADPDFLVVGAYPPGQDWDLCKAAPTAAQRKNIDNLPIPANDPVQGRDGAMCDAWRR